MPVFTVPFGYDETVDRLTVPICISDTDDQGNPVYFGWVERGVAPIAEKLVSLAAGELHDKWRASEIAEPAVHKLSRDFGRDLGIEPSWRGPDGTRKICVLAGAEYGVKKTLNFLLTNWSPCRIRLIS